MNRFVDILWFVQYGRKAKSYNFMSAWIKVRRRHNAEYFRVESFVYAWEHTHAHTHIMPVNGATQKYQKFVKWQWRSRAAHFAIYLSFIWIYSTCHAVFATTLPTFFSHGFVGLFPFPVIKCKIDHVLWDGNQEWVPGSVLPFCFCHQTKTCVSYFYWPRTLQNAIGSLLSCPFVGIIFDLRPIL